MRRAVMVVLSCLAGCGQGSKVEQAMRTEQVELEACRTTYPVGINGLFGALVRCEMGAVANYVEVTDPPENPRQQRLASELETKADQVDSGRLSRQDWQSQAADAIRSLKDAKRTTQAANAVLDISLQSRNVEKPA